MTLFEGNLPQKRQSERERETQRERARGKEKREIRNGRRRAGEQGITDCISLIGFARSVNVHNRVKAKFHGLWMTVVCGPRLSLFGGGLSLYSVL